MREWARTRDRETGNNAAGIEQWWNVAERFALETGAAEWIRRREKRKYNLLCGCFCLPAAISTWCIARMDAGYWHLRVCYGEWRISRNLCFFLLHTDIHTRNINSTTAQHVCRQQEYELFEHQRWCRAEWMRERALEELQLVWYTDADIDVYLRPYNTQNHWWKVIKST